MSARGTAAVRSRPTAGPLDASASERPRGVQGGATAHAACKVKHRGARKRRAAEMEVPDGRRACGRGGPSGRGAGCGARGGLAWTPRAWGRGRSRTRGGRTSTGGRRAAAGVTRAPPTWPTKSPGHDGRRMLAPLRLNRRTAGPHPPRAARTAAHDKGVGAPPANVSGRASRLGIGWPLSSRRAPARTPACPHRRRFAGVAGTICGQLWLARRRVGEGLIFAKVLVAAMARPSADRPTFLPSPPRPQDARSRAFVVCKDRGGEPRATSTATKGRSARCLLPHWTIASAQRVWEAAAENDVYWANRLACGGRESMNIVWPPARAGWGGRWGRIPPTSGRWQARQ